MHASLGAIALDKKEERRAFLLDVNIHWTAYPRQEVRKVGRKEGRKEDISSRIECGTVG